MNVKRLFSALLSAAAVVVIVGTVMLFSMFGFGSDVAENDPAGSGDSPIGVNDNGFIANESDNSDADNFSAQAADVEETPVITEITDLRTEEQTESPKAPAEKHRINLGNIIQYPELPTGCEVTSLTMVLAHLGFDADKTDIADNYLPKQSFYEIDGVYYGADFRNVFAGDPRCGSSYGCYAPCIKTTADNYLREKNTSLQAYDLTGTDLDELFDEYIANDIPVMIWVTRHELHESMLTTVWTTSDGESVQWRAYEHCVVLTGFDRESGLVYVSDPMVGNTSFDLSLFAQRYKELGKQAVCIK